MTPPIILQTEGLTKRFGELTAVDNLNLAVRQGEILGFLGPNGAGKTTAISMICGLLRPDRGQALLRGEPVTTAEVRTKIGVCPQSVVIWPALTCLEQLVFMGEMYGVPARPARQRADSLLEAVGLAEKRDRLARTLSGGMQRRLSLILALVHDPEILVLDEPEAGLDPQSRVLVREFIRALVPAKTVILTTHNMDEADRLASRVAIIDRGRLLTVDTAEQLKRQAAEAAPEESRPRPATLEDVFLALTGRGLRE